MRANGGQRGVVALVTGGSDGIGKAIAARLHAEGARVAICGRSQARLDSAAAEISSHGRDRLLTVQADCSRQDDLQKLHDATCTAFGPINALVNNVGTSMRASFLELTDDQWSADFCLKVFSAIRLTRLVVPTLTASGKPGRIINIVSVGGKHPSGGSAPTTITRAAGLALTKLLSKELAIHQILVNAICVGTIQSGQHDRQWATSGEQRAVFYRHLARNRGIPLGRVGLPEEIANLANFLISREASYITGAAINVDGGWSSSL